MTEVVFSERCVSDGSCVLCERYVSDGSCAL